MRGANSGEAKVWFWLAYATRSGMEGGWVGGREGGRIGLALHLVGLFHIGKHCREDAFVNLSPGKCDLIAHELDALWLERHDELAILLGGAGDEALDQLGGAIHPLLGALHDGLQSCHHIVGQHRKLLLAALVFGLVTHAGDAQEEGWARHSLEVLCVCVCVCSCHGGGRE